MPSKNHKLTAQDYDNSQEWIDIISWVTVCFIVISELEAITQLYTVKANPAKALAN